MRMKHKKKPPSAVLLKVVWVTICLATTYSPRGHPQVPSALEGLTSVFGMGTGGSPPLWSPDNLIGVPWKIRTPDLLIRSQTLYPAELRAHEHTLKMRMEEAMQP
jgi:hypothetical protein